MSKNPMQKQREDLRFRRAVDYVHQESRGIKRINSNELAHLNQILTDTDMSPWRFEEADIQIPSGRVARFNVLSNPIDRARDILGDAMQMVGNKDVAQAGLYAYQELVSSHLFRDANRRTAVLATIWILETGGIRIDAGKLLAIPLGDLRSLADKERFGRDFDAILANS